MWIPSVAVLVSYEIGRIGSANRWVEPIPNGLSLLAFRDERDQLYINVVDGSKIITFGGMYNRDLDSAINPSFVDLRHPANSRKSCGVNESCIVIWAESLVDLP